MKKRLFFWGLLFLSLWAIKLFLPDNLDSTRKTFLPTIITGSDFRESILAIGRGLSGRDSTVYVWENSNADEAESGVKADISADFPLESMISQNLLGFSPPPSDPVASTLRCVSKGEPTADFGTAEIIATALASSDVFSATKLAPAPAPTPTPTPAPTPAPAPTPTATDGQQAKVDEFLQRQAAFSQHAIPANVSYDVPILPFEFSSPTAISVSSGFGYRVHPIHGDTRFHYGTDIGVGDGTEVTAFAGGTVIGAQELTGYGLTVIIQHADGFSTLYAHCSSLLCSYGDTVEKGQVIALSGHSGNVTGSHLHFELMQNDKYLNPEFYL